MFYKNVNDKIETLEKNKWKLMRKCVLYLEEKVMKAYGGEIVKAIGKTLFFLGLGISILLYCEWRGTLDETIYVCWESIWVSPVFAVILFLLYYKKGKKTVKTIANRKLYLDYARVLAAVCVILAHACNMQRGEEAAPWRIALLTICAGMGLVCNPLYVMISGSLLLSSEKKESVPDFYYRRFTKVVIPLVVYYSVFLCVSGQMSFLPPKNLGKGFLQILAGESGIVPHYWLIYTLICLYILAPFVRMVARKLNEQQLYILFWSIMIMELVLTLLPLAGVPIGFLLSLVQWTGVFIVGYIVTEKRSKALERWVLVLGAVSTIVICSIILQDYNWIGYLCNTSPGMVLVAGSILILLSKIKYTPTKAISTAISSFAKYSYAIILVHWYGLFVVTWGKLGLQPLRFGCIGGIVLTVVVATLVCFLMGVAGDNTIVFVVQSVFELPYEWIKQRKHTKNT